MNGGLVLVARAGFFIPNGKSDRSSGARRAFEDLLRCLVFSAGDDRAHRGTTLLPLLVAGAGGVSVMVNSGHLMIEDVTNGACCSQRAKRILFVLVEIA